MEVPDLSAPGSVPPHSQPSQSLVPAPSPTPAEPVNPAGLHLPLAAPGLTRTHTSGQPQLSEEEQEVMFSTLEAIFQRAEEAEGGVGVSELRAVSTDGEEGRTGGVRNVEALRDVRGILDQMWWSESKFMTRTAEVLADGSRDRTSWSRPG
jgi:hypothetical protein